MITLVAMIDENDGLNDENGNLLYDLPNDRKFFKAVTSNKAVVMGRKTWESLPEKPLKRRKNYVLTMDEEYVAEGATVIHDIEDILKLAKGREVFVIGGSELYFQMMEHADHLILTHVHHVRHDATRIFPNVPVQEWKLVKVQPHKKDDKHAYDFTFAWYKRRSAWEEEQKAKGVKPRKAFDPIPQDAEVKAVVKKED